MVLVFKKVHIYTTSLVLCFLGLHLLVQGVYVQSLGQEGPLGVAKSRTRLSDFTFTSHFHALEKHGNPLQCSCLENPRDAGAWWAAVYGVTQSRTRLR